MSQQQPDAFNPELLTALRAESGQGATDSQWNLFVELCRVRNLIPGRDVILQLRNAKEWDAVLREKIEVKKVTLITAIDAYRKIAERTGLYGGRKPVQWVYLDSNGEPTKISTIPLGVRPHAAIVRVIRKDWAEPLEAVARFDAYCQSFGFGDNKKPTQMWENRGEEMLQKCAEALALRTAFPEELGNVYIREEMPADEDSAVPAEKSSHIERQAAPAAIVAPVVNQSAAPEQPVTPAPAAEPVQKTDTPATETKQPEPAQPVVETTIQHQPDGSATVEHDRLPNQNEFGAFTARASKLMRDVLPKAGIKAAADAFKAYTARVSGQGKELNTRKLTVNQWESLLAAVEKAPLDSVSGLIKGAAK